MDIITAKATPEEQRLVPHHLIDILHPNKTYTVVDYRNKALDIVSSYFSTTSNELELLVLNLFRLTI